MFTHTTRRTRELEKEVTMDKYGVREDVDQEKLEKVAAKGCPKCGKELIQHGNTLLCPVHGSEPFEKGKH